MNKSNNGQGAPTSYISSNRVSIKKDVQGSAEVCGHSVV